MTTMPPIRESLPPGMRVGDYHVVKAIGKGGFSLIYLATEDDSGQEVVLKEYMPKQIARRDQALRVIALEPRFNEQLQQGRKLFFQEVTALASLRHPNIVRVLGFFLANRTAYLVMPNERGRNLGTYVRERKGGLSTSFILGVFVPILDALSLLHARAMLHLDVKPGNIHLRHGDQPLLLDLGAVHAMSLGRRRGGQVVTTGYSPLEQYIRGGNIGPWTDVYAVGASIRTCMSGKPPPAAIERRENDTLEPAAEVFRNRYPPFLLEAVDWSLRMDIEDRPRDAGVLRDALLQRTTPTPLTGNPTTTIATFRSEWGRRESAVLPDSRWNAPPG